ncbi:MAG: HAD family hydrolase [archaeon]|nr:HAD family hydrolase [archaeon]
MGFFFSSNGQKETEEKNEEENKENSSEITQSGNIIIFDWDDTLMSTYFVQKRKSLNQENLKKVKKLGQKVSKVLSKAKDLGTVYIVSNSSNQWISYSSSELLGLDQSVFKNIFILPLKDCPEINKFKKEDWKTKVFELLENDFKNYKNVIFIGDSEEDIKYSQSLNEKYENINSASVKFISRPLFPDVLEKEIDFLYSNLETYLNNRIKIDLNGLDSMNLICEKGSVNTDYSSFIKLMVT